jgi:hypothetical protein
MQALMTTLKTQLLPAAVIEFYANTIASLARTLAAINFSDT